MTAADVRRVFDLTTEGDILLRREHVNDLAEGLRAYALAATTIANMKGDHAGVMASAILLERFQDRLRPHEIFELRTIIDLRIGVLPDART